MIEIYGTLDPSEERFMLAVLKGVVERSDGTVYFGSLGGYTYYRALAVKTGLVVTWWDAIAGTVTFATDKGLDVYIERALWALPSSGRSYMWDWKAVEPDLIGTDVSWTKPKET